MLHHLFLVMSLAGSAVVLLYGITYPITRRYFPHAWRKRILHLALFFYLFPVPLFKYKVLLPIDHQLMELFPLYNQYCLEHFDATIETSYMVNLREGSFYVGAGAAAVGALFLCMTAITLVTVIKQVRQYRSLRGRYLSGVFQETVPPEMEQEFERIREELKVGKNARLIVSKLCGAPMTIGVFSPTVILPVSAGAGMEPEDRGYILKHELLHIRHRDLFGKFLALFALALHWYNPFCYFLYHELCAVSELDCDYGVIRDADAPRRRRYGGLILDMAAAQDKQERFAVGLIHNSAATFRRRLLEVREPGKNTGPILAWVLMVVICLAGTVTAFAYRPPNTQKLSHDFDSNSELGFIPWWEPPGDRAGPLPFDRFFTDENGEVFPLEEPASRTACPHEYVDGMVTEHTKDGGEGCTLVKTEARRCRSCGFIDAGKVYFECFSVNCLHGEGKWEEFWEEEINRNLSDGKYHWTFEEQRRMLQ